jgi:uncharacterized membrane protein
VQASPQPTGRAPLSETMGRPWRWFVPGAIKKRHWAPASVILALAALMLVGGWVQKSPCLHTNPSWANGLPYRYACYSDVIPLYGIEGFEKGSTFPYEYSWIDGKGTPEQKVAHMEYPVLTGMLMWVSAKITHTYIGAAESFIYLPLTSQNNVFFNVCALFASLFWLITVWCVTRMTRRRVWDGVIAALSPLILVQAFTNWDMLAVALATTGMLAWSRRRPALAGILIGLGTAAKLYPVLLLIPLLALCLRAGELKRWRRAAIAAAISWGVVNAPIAILFPDGWYEFIHLNSTRGADPDSLYNVIAQFSHWGGFDGPLGFNQAPTILNSFIAATLIACCIAIVLIALSAPRRPRFAQLAFLTVSAFLITNKVWSPQYSLWLIPLAVLAVPRWKPLLAWMVIDAFLWVPRMYFYLGEKEGGWGETPFLDMVIARDAAVAGLCALIIYEIYHPARDLVRRSGEDDPTGGVLDGAPDAFVLGRGRGLRTEVAPG